MSASRTYTALLALLALECLLAGCSGDSSTNPLPPATGELDLALCSPSRGGFSLASTNLYFPLVVGRQSRLEGEEDGSQLVVLITVLDETEVVAGVTTRVLEERESEDGELVEVSRNFLAEASDGTVCYFGEAVDNYENGVIVSHGGSWRADQPGNRPGIIMPADPQPGLRFQMEAAPGVAEDEGQVIESGERVEVPAGAFTETIRVREFNPLDGTAGDKVFAADVGVVVDESVELVSF
jgi:hypothetical protein